MSDLGDQRTDRFRELYADNVDRITGYALRRVASPEDAADVVAETFLVAWRRTLDLPAGEEARLWLYGVARRVLANHRRGTLRRERLGWRLRDQLGQLHADDPADELVETRAVRVAMARLGDLDREVLRLHVWEQLAPREIAVVLGLRPEVVRTRLSRARTRLRTELLGEDAGDVRPRAGHAPGVRTTYLSEEER